uniref:BSD domain-containing protein n=1 Tax=Aegilops tauschii subsp. strangulata TaxID=200361 RepID=A0A453HA04_AEGTS
MSWLARSIATSLNIPEDSGADDDPDAVAAAASHPSARTPPPPHSAAADGVKEDLTELSKTLNRQFWGVANFLAPPPGEGSPSPSPSPSSAGGQSTDAGTPPEIAGIQRDFSEISGRFRSGISRISSHKAVSGFSSIASNFFAPEDGEEEELLEEEARHEREDDEGRHYLEKMARLGVADDEVRDEWEEQRARHQADDDEVSDEWEEQRVRHRADDGKVWPEEQEEVDGPELERARVMQEEEVEEEWDVIGITDEVLTFATNIARHPETWLDFPLLPDEEESDGPFSYFDMSDAQQEHALAIGHLAPTLAALRIELCPIHMSEECFWKIYFVLLHPRLSKHDAELLSTPQSKQHATEQLRRHKDDFGTHSEDDSSKDVMEAFPSVRQHAASITPITDFEIEKHPIQGTEVTVVDKTVIKEQLREDGSKASNVMQETFDDDIDDWFDEEADLAGHTTILIGDEEDVSFSDLEDDDDTK